MNTFPLIAACESHSTLFLPGFHRCWFGGLRMRPTPRPFCSHQQIWPALQIWYER